MKRPVNPAEFLNAGESARVAEAVAEAERQTSAEVKLVIVRHCWDDIRFKAARVFNKMDLDRTKLRNCVMVMLVTTNREFLIYGDQGIHEKVGQGFWDGVRDGMSRHFREGRFDEGLVWGIRQVGPKLSEHFPRRADDRNEIPDEVGHAE